MDLVSLRGVKCSTRIRDLLEPEDRKRPLTSAPRRYSNFSLTTGTGSSPRFRNQASQGTLIRRRGRHLLCAGCILGKPGRDDLIAPHPVEPHGRHGLLLWERILCEMGRSDSSTAVQLHHDRISYME